MKANRGYSFRIYPTPEQQQSLWQIIGACRFVYNISLDQRRDWWRHFRKQTGRNISAATQSLELSQLRNEVDWLKAVPRVCLEQSVRDLDKAFSAFYSGRSFYPKHRVRGLHKSVRFQAKGVAIQNLNAKWASIKLPNLTPIKMRYTREAVGRIRNATVSHDRFGWIISITCEVEHSIPAPLPECVGIDRGVATTLALSTGQMLAMPASLERIESVKRKAQRVVARRKRGSNRRRRAQARVARLQARQARIRRDFHHRAALDIAKRFGVAVLERLNTKAMTASAAGTVAAPGKNVRQKAGLNRSILNAGWHTFARILTYKMEERGGLVIEVPAAYSSQTCSTCGVIDARSRESQAVFRCVSCGHRDHADVNAAKEILRRGSTPLLRVEGAGCGPVEARTLAVREHGLDLALV